MIKEGWCVKGKKESKKKAILGMKSAIDSPIDVCDGFQTELGT